MADTLISLSLLVRAEPGATTPYDLRSDYSASDLHVIREYGIDLHKLATFITRTRAMGGTVASVTLCLAVFITLFRDDSDAEYIISCAAFGVDMDFTPPADTTFYRVENYVQEDHVAKVDAQIQRELSEGRIVPIPLSFAHGISAIGSVRKGEHAIRLISDYSRPIDCSVNSGITLRKETFSKVADAAALLRPRALHCKVDISEAYRAYPMAESWWKRHVFEWRGVLYSDLRMPFGNSGAPSAFHRFSMAFARLIQSRGFPAVVAYLDDFWLSA